MALAVVLLVWSVLTTASTEEVYHDADCSDDTPETKPPIFTTEPPTVDALLGNWTVVKHDKDIEELNCLTINFEMVENSTIIRATLSSFDISSQKPSSHSEDGVLDTNNTVFILANAKDKYYLHKLDVQKYAVIFTCNGNKPVKFVATKNETLSELDEFDELKDVKHVCSGATVSAQQLLIATTLTALALKLLI